MRLVNREQESFVEIIDAMPKTNGKLQLILLCYE